MRNISSKLAVLCCLILALAACKPAPKTAKYPDWAKNAVIYEVNTRQYTPEGTFKAFATHLSSLKDLGVDILWFMPIHPIGLEKRKVPDGMKTSLGSYYSVQDYEAVNPEFGTEADFKSLVNQAHKMGFKVIIDWVANHTAWDNKWVTGHPDWYKQDSAGKIMSAFDWTDVAKLNYDNKEMRKAMIASMKYWIDKCDIDGFRCDVAGEVPVDFWEDARAELQKTKPLFMLAENEDKTELFKKAFDAGYGWNMCNGIFTNVAKGKDSLLSVIRLQQKIDSTFPAESFKMNFTTNHDENSWNGTTKEKYGDGEKAFAVLSYTLPGIPLIYSGQEAGLNKRLQFFIKDTIDWTTTDCSKFYMALNNLKHTSEALWTSPFGGTFRVVANSEPEKVLTFVREKGKSKVLVILNLSKDSFDMNLKDESLLGDYLEIFGNSPLKLENLKHRFGMQPWGYWVLVAK